MSSSLKKNGHERHSFSSISMSKKSEKSLSYLGIKMERMKMEKSGKHLKLYTGEWNKNEKQVLKAVHENLTRKRLNGHRYKELFRLQARKAKVSDLMLGRRYSLSNGSGYVTKANGSHEVDARDVESSCSCSKSLENMDEHAQDMHCTKSQPDIEIESHKECVICMRGGELLCCDGRGCRRNFHLSCIDPPLTCVPPGVWYCIWCIKKEIEYGVHSVSEGIESILDLREVVSDDEVMQRQKQYLVKYKGLAHVHNRWIPERQLLHEAPMLFARFKKNAIKMKWKTEWSVPHRMLQKRLLLFPENCDNHFHGHGGNDSDCHYAWLVKWTGLNYDDATWELENASFLRTPEAMKLIREFEIRHQKSKRTSHPSKEIEGKQLTCPELTEFPFGDSRGIRDCHLTYVNKLREYWYRGRNAVVFDDQERVVKVVLFILSLLGDVRQPFLIITASPSLSLWEAEFSRWALSANIVVYKGNRDVRDIIRTLEFYNEDGCMMFEVLLSPPDVLEEDLKILELIKWEAIIIDECQRPQILVHSKQIKMLPADMRLLLVNCQINDRKFNYQSVLSLLDPEFDGTDEHALETGPNFDICKLKERLAQFVAFECKAGTSMFAEYWVPVQLSNVQVEQYCASLLSNSMLLCSSWKNDSVGSLRDILILNRKCCGHPYLVDKSLQSSITSGLPVVDHLDVGINVSGKLQLLDKILLEIKKRGLRVLILFQALGCSGGPISIGDILDDFVHQKFGKDSYARIDGGIVRSKKQAALNMFNNKENGKFVCLIDNRACLPSIKLSSVDIIILFDSDWNPINDLRALQKITIDSQFEQLKVFRLYSSHTVEEKVLILAKQGVALDSNTQNINRSTCHMLLSWGAFYLFNKLDNFDGCQTSLSRTHISSNQSILEDVFNELSALLPNDSDNSDPTSCSIILNVNQNDGVYPRNISLLGEVESQSMESSSVINHSMDNGPPHVFWSNLLQGRRPMCKYLSGPSQRSRRKAQSVDGLLEKTEVEGDAVKSKHRKVVNNTFNLVSPTRRLRSKRRVKERKLAGAAKDFSLECVVRDAVTLGDHVTEVRQHCETATPISGVMPSEASSPTVQSHIFRAQGITLPSHQPQVPRQSPIEDSTELSNSSETLQSACLDPLQREMERIQKNKEQAIKMHEDTKLKLKSECDREIAEIRKKYDLLLQEAEMALVEQQKDLETCYNKVHKNKLLAEAFSHKHKSTSEEPQQGSLSSLMNKIFQPCVQQTGATTTLRLDEQLSASLPMAGPPVTASVQVVSRSSEVQTTDVRTTPRIERSSVSLPMTGPPPVTPPVPVVTHSSAFQQTDTRTTPRIEQYLASQPATVQPVFFPVQLGSYSTVRSTTLLRPPSIPTIHGRGTLLAGSALRAPAPHLRHVRHSPSVSAPNYLISPNQMPNLPSPVNPPVRPLMPTLPTPRQTHANQNELAGFSSQEAHEGCLSSVVFSQLQNRGN